MIEIEFTKIKKLERRLTEKIGKSYFVRFHMFMILSATVVSGVVCSKILVWAGLSSMPLRYGIAIILSYLMFFLFIKLWLLYIGIGRNKLLQFDKKDGGGSIVDSIPLPGGSISDSSGSVAFNGFRSGASGGGGAGRSFAEGIAPMKVSTGTGGGSSGIGDAAGGILDVGDDSFLTVVAIVLLIILVLAIFIAGGYLIWSAPAILSNAAFHALLVAGFARKVRQAEETHWETTILKATWWAFLIVLVFAIAFGIIAQMVFPEAVTVRDFIVLFFDSLKRGADAPL